MSGHRRAASAALATGVLLVLATASSVFAKEGIALLDAPLPGDAGGTRVDIGWVVTLPGPQGPERFSGANAFIRVRGSSGGQALGWAKETPAGSGHYVATVTVPDGGIMSVGIGLADPDCQTKSCANNGWMLELSSDLSGFAVATTSVVERTAPTTPATAAWQPPFLPMGVSIAGLLLAGVVVLSRSRRTQQRQANQG
jgi:hypothetical protein